MGRRPKPIPDNNWKIAKTAIPSLPERLDPVARDEWDRITPFLKALDRIAHVDRQTITSYCIEWSTFVRLMKHFNNPDAPLSAEGPRCDVIHPIFPPLIRAAEATIKLASQFGMTARSRYLEHDRPVKPDVIKILEGNRRKIAEGKLNRPSIPMLLDFSNTDMRPPEWLNHRAREEYDSLGRALDLLDLFTPLDVTSIAINACLFDLYLRAYEQVITDKIPVFNALGVPTLEKENPLYRVAHDCRTILMRFWKEYGQTPRFRKVFDGERKVEKEVPLVFRGKLAQ